MMDNRNEVLTTAVATHLDLVGKNDRPMPNVVYILADDMGYGDMGCNNSFSRIPTSNLDRLATQGMRFTDAHASSAVCTPSRYSILTGRP